MEDIVEIFIAGAKKISKIKGCSQASIAKGTKGVAGLKGSQGTISSYFIGRTRPKPEVMQAIADFLKTPYNDILDLGRQEIAKQNHPTLTEDEIRRIVREEQSAHQPIDITVEKHRQLVDKFDQKNLAMEINEELIELERLDKNQLKEILGIIKDRKFRLEQEAQKKRPAANGDE
jgi:hypothetical protein